MALRVPETNFWDHFSIQTSPQNPQKHTLGTKIGPRKVIFGHFAFFWYFYLIFPWARGQIFKSISSHEKFNEIFLKFFRPILNIKRHQKNTQAKLFEKLTSRQHALDYLLDHDVYENKISVGLEIIA